MYYIKNKSNKDYSIYKNPKTEWRMEIYKPGTTSADTILRAPNGVTTYYSKNVSLPMDFIKYKHALKASGFKHK